MGNNTIAVFVTKEQLKMLVPNLTEEDWAAWSDGQDALGYDESSIPTVEQIKQWEYGQSPDTLILHPETLRLHT